MSGDPESNRQLDRALVADAADDELLQSMSKQHGDVGLANAALEEFISRHRGYVAKIVRNLIDRYGTASGWNDNEFAEAIFRRVYKSAHTYRPVVGLESAAALARLKAWIGKIANNLLVDRHRRCRVQLFDDEFLKAIEVSCEPDDFPSDFHRHLYDGAQLLRDNERLVLVRTLRYIQAGKRSYMPHAASRALRDELQTTAVNVRKIRQRALEHLRDYLSKRGFDVGIFQT